MGMLIDATNLILGRMASIVAKHLLAGEEVTIINAEKAVVTGRRKEIFDEYDARMRIRSLTNPRKGPFHPRRPDDLVRRTVRGMLPYDKPKGREAYKRLRVYVGAPPDVQEKACSLPEAHIDRLSAKRFVKIEELSKHFGVKL